MSRVICKGCHRFSTSFPVDFIPTLELSTLGSLQELMALWKLEASTLTNQNPQFCRVPI